MLALRVLAKRYQAPSAEIGSLDTELDRLVAAAAPTLTALLGSALTALARCWSQPMTTPAGCAVSLLCDAVWRLPDPGVLGQDHPAPAQPGR
jgi:hypothetical protein